MKILRAAIIILLVMCIFIGVHSFLMNKMGKSLGAKNDEVFRLASAENWETVRFKLEGIRQEWEKYSIWASLTISTEDIEQLEISLAQAEAFADLEEKTNFFGEFIMFSKLVNHIPHREGFHIEEIL
ncbi:MAG: DUF4363 family protein [Clostridia bacterium]|nr:DUF4363 family protein [Clostridia bacterium]